MSKQPRKKALGSGLDALLGEDISLSNPVSGISANEGIRFLSLDQLKPNPDQPREHFNRESLAELAESIRQQGIIQPILAESRADGGYMLIAGERRWRAAELAGLNEVPVIVRDFSPEQKLEIALVENVQREDLTPMEEARAYRHLMDALGLSQQEVADKVGKKRSTVANSLRLLKLPETMRAAVEEGKLTAGHARALLAVTNPADQELLFSKILSLSLSVRDAEATATEMNRGHKGNEKPKASKTRRTQDRDPEIDSLEQRFIEALGTKVSMKGNLARGRLEISWFSRDDLDRIYELLINEG
ncbi:MAG: ParB/RepB/Spo0J family partition protein [Spirochaetaceae bacterium]|nr:ParB/RepB/Spo0J family partition protein [Spirochaetaceae bacterium]RKX78376.1 MAG: chromosome partitioning protein ParB [Spirochaetota bacterium]RKX89122.1 MAG: chromosome partitioning protein ParB [Spirochaetota bacterium]RKX94445.1 MAG: chromosome partitioning protein ParB [Spirochaetota bacterium]